MHLITLRGRSYQVCRTLALGMLACLPRLVGAQTLTFPTTPLYTAQGVEPNFIISIDNSGSTDWEVSEFSNNGEAWWNPGNTITGCTTVGFAGCFQSAGNDSASPGTLNFNAHNSSGFYDYDYLFPAGSYSSASSSSPNLGGRFYNDDGAGGVSGFYAIPPVAQFAWARMNYTLPGGSPQYNGMYYDPTAVYSPWPSDGNTTYSNATVSAVLTDANATSSTTATFDLTQDRVSNQSTATSTLCTSITANGASNWGFRVFNGMVLPKNTCYSTGGGTWVSLASNTTIGSGSGQLNLNATTIYIRYFPATFYVPHGTDLSALGYGASTVSGYAPDGTTVLDGYEIKSANFVATTAATDVSGTAHTASDNYNRAIQNFANWFQYYRKRYLAIRGGMGAAFDGVAGMRTAMFTIDDSNGAAWNTTNDGNLTMLDLSDTASTTAGRKKFYDNVYTYVRGAFGTPNRESVEYLGNQYRRTGTGAPITASCQKNFAMLFTDGYSNNLNSDYTSITNSNGDGNTTSAFVSSNSTHSTGVPYSDTSDKTMADRAMYDYIGPLVPSSTYPLHKVSVDASCYKNGALTIPYSSQDCNDDLHSVFYGIILNSYGFVWGVNQAATTDPYNNPPSTTASSSGTYPPTSTTGTWAWPTGSALATDYTPAAVDDMWHATVNARGLMFNARNTTEIKADFAAILSDIIARTASASSVATTSSQLNTGTQVFEALFNTNNWTGELIDFPLSTGTATSGSCAGISLGNTCGEAWEAGSVLTGQIQAAKNVTTSRNIYTYNVDSKTGVPFQWSSIGATNQRLLETAAEASASNSTNAQLRLNWIRGDQSHEASTTNPNPSPSFHVRASLLGDVIDSAPFYVGVPPFAYGTHNYAAFQQNNLNRQPIVYVGSNDGMLHGFETSPTSSCSNPNGGCEVLAYIPSKAYGTTTTPTLLNLTATPYAHEYIVDGSPTVGDAWLSDNAWHSILVGTMAYGGKGVYALDVTDPTKFGTASNASSIVKWEFTDADDSDLGYTFSEVSIVQTHNASKPWAAILGNGYNSSSGKAALYILSLDHSAANSWSATAGDMIKLVVPSDGSSAPNGLSSPSAIDIDGDGVVDRVYAGDLHGNMWRFDISNTDTSQWKVTQIWSGVSSGALIGKPIQDAPDVSKNTLTSGLIVYFGTGRYVDATDNTVTNQVTQDFYALFDKGASSAIDPSTLVKQTINTSVTQTTDANGNLVDYYTTTSNPVTANNGGWYLELHNTSPLLGERVVADPLFEFGTIYFSTLVPSQDACSYGGQSTLYALQAVTGTASQSGTFIGSVPTNASGFSMPDNGITSSPTSLIVSPFGGATPGNGGWGGNCTQTGGTCDSAGICQGGNGTGYCTPVGGQPTDCILQSNTHGTNLSCAQARTGVTAGRRSWREFLQNH